MHRRIVVGLLAALVFTALPLSGDKKKADPKYKNKFSQIEVIRFEIQPGVEKFSADWLVTMTDELVKQLQESKKFKEVLREGESSNTPDAATLKVTGTVTEFNAGSRAKRYLVGFGAGKTKVKAHVKIVDRTSGEVLFEDDVDGKVIMGIMGGDSVGATRGLAKEVAKKVKEQFF